MFKNAEIKNRIDKQSYKTQLPELRTQLLAIQRQLRQCDFPVIILIAGVDGGGKGDIINLLNEWMDARYIHTIAYDEPSDEEQERPKFWRIWRDLPAKGSIGVFFGAWYSESLGQYSRGDIDQNQLQQQLVRINQFEQQQIDDGVLIIKYWLHLSKSQQIKRINKLERNPETRWKVSQRDKKHLRHYPQFIESAEIIIKATSTDDAPWRIIGATNLRYSSFTIGQDILTRITEQIRRRATKQQTQKPRQLPAHYGNFLAMLNVEQALNEDIYQQQLRYYQSKIAQLSRKARQQKLSCILVFEGWDAAGKGGAIRRLTRAMDARNYRVIAIAAPTDEEHQHHYLWRFWRHLPRAGKVTIYDRSWYGRVLVERVENFASAQEWQRAYAEIINFEQALVDHGILLMKFWLHIDPDEQLQRFQQRQQLSYKKHKITEEDYRNRAQWEAYEVAVNEMVAKTSTADSPWLLVEANNKKYARIKILKAYCLRLQQMLGEA